MENIDAYRRWRDAKLAAYGPELSFPAVELADTAYPSVAELDKIKDLLGQFNMALYVGAPTSLAKAKTNLPSFSRHLGLTHLDANICADEDAITPIAVSEGLRRRRYIPYTNRKISWHTDGYYNTSGRQVRAMTLHCVSPAAVGGDNQLMDPEIAYILLREENPEYVRALMHGEAMTIPANDEGTMEGGTGFVRPAQTGPVFSFAPDNGALHMRYTARTRSIEWRDDDVTAAAVAFLSNLLENPSPYKFDHHMEAGHGVVCNNVLHNRSAFEDTDGTHRMLLRGRYYDRIAPIANS